VRYFQYFKPGQKIHLRSLSSEAADDRLEVFTAHLQECGAGYLDLNLPYRFQDGENITFSEGMPFEILSDSMGMGLRLTGRFRAQKGPGQIRLNLNNDLQIFKRRVSTRQEITIGLGYTKGQGALRTFRAQWEKNIQIIADGRNLDKLPAFPRISVNLSTTGIRFSIKLPVEIADLCMLLIKIDETPPICALAEVVWLAGEENDGRIMVGMQFINILEADQKRIAQFVKTSLRQNAQVPEKTD